MDENLKKRNTRLFVEPIVEEMDGLNEMGGPDSIEEFVYVMEEIVREAQKRLTQAKEVMEKG